MKTFTKKLLIALTALLVVGVMVFCVACNSDPYSGNYKNISEDEKEQFIADTVDKIEEFDISEMGNYQIIYNVHDEDVEDGVKGISDIQFEITVEGSKTQTIIKSTEEYGDEKFAWNATIWTDEESGDTYYQITVDGETETGKYTGQENNSTLRDAIQYSQTLVRILPWTILGMIANALEEDGAQIATSDDKIKIVLNDEDNTPEEASTLVAYLIFEGDNSIRCKLDMSTVSKDDTSTTHMELIPSTASVTMPNFD